MSKPFTRAEVERLLIDVGRAIDANGGHCYLIEEVLCRCTSLCSDMLALLESHAELLAALENACGLEMQLRFDNPSFYEHSQYPEMFAAWRALVVRIHGKGRPA